MIFTDLKFLPFALLCFAVYWALRSHQARKLWLLFASYVFYGAWDWRFLALLLFSTGLDYWIGLKYDEPGLSQAGRKNLLRLSLVANLGVLGFFKYFGFFTAEAARLGQWLGLPLDVPTLHIILPVGISFYTFQSLGYVLERHWKRIPTEKSFLNFALFIAFWPQLVAGPIVRASQFLPQLASARRFPLKRVRLLALLFLAGYFKKAVIADNLAPIVDQFYAAPTAFGAWDAALASLLFTVQIYGDFSGYSDMAIACAGFLGFRLTRNFLFPFMATNLSVFWQRWHISLSTWVRDFVFFPLLSVRRLRGYALLCSMLVVGFWHGAGWNFILFGAMHGLGLMWYGKNQQRLGALFGAWASPLGRVTTFVYFSLSLSLFFRAKDIGASWQVLGRYMDWRASDLAAQHWWVLLALPALLALHTLAYQRFFARGLLRVPNWVFALGYGAAFALLLPFIQMNSQPFVYFNF